MVPEESRTNADRGEACWAARTAASADTFEPCAVRREGPSLSSNSFDPLFAPRRVIARHAANQTLEVPWNWAPARSRFPASEQAETLRCQGTRVLGLTTVKASRQSNQRLSSASVTRVGLSARRRLILRSR